MSANELSATKTHRMQMSLTLALQGHKLQALGQAVWQSDACCTAYIITAVILNTLLTNTTAVIMYAAQHACDCHTACPRA